MILIDWKELKRLSSYDGVEFPPNQACFQNFTEDTSIIIFFERGQPHQALHFRHDRVFEWGEDCSICFGFFPEAGEEVANPFIMPALDATSESTLERLELGVCRQLAQEYRRRYEHVKAVSKYPKLPPVNNIALPGLLSNTIEASQG